MATTWKLKDYCQERQTAHSKGRGGDMAGAKVDVSAYNQGQGLAPHKETLTEIQRRSQDQTRTRTYQPGKTVQGHPYLEGQQKRKVKEDCIGVFREMSSHDHI